MIFKKNKKKNNIIFDLDNTTFPLEILEKEETVQNYKDIVVLKSKLLNNFFISGSLEEIFKYFGKYFDNFMINTGRSIFAIKILLKTEYKKIFNIYPYIYIVTQNGKNIFLATKETIILLAKNTNFNINKKKLFYDNKILFFILNFFKDKFEKYFSIILRDKFLKDIIFKFSDHKYFFNLENNLDYIKLKFKNKLFFFYFKNIIFNILKKSIENKFYLNFLDICYFFDLKFEILIFVNLIASDKYSFFRTCKKRLNIEIFQEEKYKLFIDNFIKENNIFFGDSYNDFHMFGKKNILACSFSYSPLMIKKKSDYILKDLNNTKFIFSIYNFLRNNEKLFG